MSKFLSGAGAAVRLDNQPDGNPAPSAVSGAASTCTTSLWGHSRTWLVRRVLLVCWDALGWAAALLAAAFLRAEFVFEDLALGALGTAFLIAIGIQLGIGGLLQTYRGRHGVGSMDEAINVTGVIALSGSMLFLINFFMQPPLVARSVPLVAVPIAVLLAVGSRLAVRLRREHRYRPDYSEARRVIIYGAGPEGQRMLSLMLSDPDGGYLPVAMLDDNRVYRRRRISGVAVCGTRADIAGVASDCSADMLVIADRSLPASVVGEVAVAAGDAGLAVHTVPGLADLLRPISVPTLVPTPRPPGDRTAADAPAAPRPDGTGPIAVVSAVALQGRSKRLFDITVSLVAVLMMLPLLAAISLVLLVSGGQVIYRAPRVGRNGQPFTMFKFATMIRGNGGPRVSREGDPRITPVGRWLRATKLNELPQIFNVIKGDMSLVGPRPEDPRYAQHYSARQRRVLAVRPGMTSLAYLHFGDEQAMIEKAQPSDIDAFYLTELLPEKLDIELSYVNKWTLVEDLRIIARTIRQLLR